MCHEIEVHFPDRVKARGEHAGFEWLVVINPRMGFHCGYVRVLPGHPWHGQDDSQIGADVHGGITFCAYDTPCTKGGADDGYWLGFDCGHGQDMADFGGTPKPVSYLEQECRRLCEQAAAAAGGGNIMTTEQKKFLAGRIWDSIVFADDLGRLPVGEGQSNEYYKNVIVSAINAALPLLPPDDNTPDPEASFFENQKPLLLAIADTLAHDGIGGKRSQHRIFLCPVSVATLAAAETAHHHAASALRGFVNLHWRQRGAVIARAFAP